MRLSPTHALWLGDPKMGYPSRSGKSAVAQKGNGLIDGALVPEQTRMRCAKHDVIGHAL
jgi:hypothetical protein